MSVASYPSGMYPSQVLANDAFYPSSPVDSKRAALEQCIARVKQAIQPVNLVIPRENVKWSKPASPVPIIIPDDIVVANCGHIYERIAIQPWQATGGCCTLCASPISTLSRIELEGHIGNWEIPTSSNFKSMNPELAAKFHEIAKIYVATQDYEEAFKCYSQALQYTNSSQIYAEIPQLYDELDEPDNARLSRFHLSLYQLQEEKIQEAIQTLQSCQAMPLVVGLTLQLSSSPENLTWAMAEAANQENAEDSIFIYKQIIIHFPTQFDAYQKLISLIKDPKEKGDLLLKGADQARVAKRLDWETIFRKEIEISSLAVSKEQWAAACTIHLPPYPQELKDFLAEECTIWPGKKRVETHIVVPLFPRVDINGSLVPTTLDSLNQLDKSSGGPGYRYFLDKIPKNIPAEQEFHYGVMTNDVIPGSRDIPPGYQIGLLPNGYEAPSVFDAARAILWENRRSGKRYFNDKPWTYTRCKDKIQGDHLVVGGFNPIGLDVGFFSSIWVDKVIGIAGWRKF